MKFQAYSPYTYTENFDSPELNGFAGLFVSYLYNVDDERVMKISPQGVTKYITVGNGQVLAEYDGYNNLQYNYIYGNGEKLAKINTGGTKEYYHNDYLGSVRRVSNSTGTVTWSRDYYPFGEIREATGANEDNHYNYEGKEKDLETDLWNNWNRHFDDKGRFTQVDPLWSKYPSLSPYVRVANNPLKYIDPSGLYYVYELDEEGNRRIDPESGEEIKYWVIDVNVEGDGNDVTSYTGEGWDWDIGSYENYSGADAVWDAFKLGVGGAFGLGMSVKYFGWKLGSSLVNNPTVQDAFWRYGSMYLRHQSKILGLAKGMGLYKGSLQNYDISTVASYAVGLGIRDVIDNGENILQSNYNNRPNGPRQPYYTQFMRP